MVEQVPEKIKAWSGIDSRPMRLIGCNHLTIKLIKPTGEQAYPMVEMTWMEIIELAWNDNCFGNVDIDMKVEMILAVK